MKKESTVVIIIIIIQRVLGFPFFAGLSLVWAIIMWIRWMCNFVWYGGEAISYTNKTSRTTIRDVFTKLQEIQDKVK